MVWLELVDASGDEVIYDYMPESRTANRGRLSVNKATREYGLISKSGEDELDWYRGHAWREIDKMIDAGEYPQETYVAWY